jgi:hypothetical protein
VCTVKVCTSKVVISFAGVDGLGPRKEQPDSLFGHSEETLRLDIESAYGQGRFIPLNV